MFKATNTSAAVRDAPSSWCRLDILGHRLYYACQVAGRCLAVWRGASAAGQALLPLWKQGKDGRRSVLVRSARTATCCSVCDVAKAPVGAEPPGRPWRLVGHEEKIW